MAETLELDDVLYRVEGYILKKFYHLPHYQLEEMVQEAKIVAWKHHLDGMSVKLICIKARYRVIQLLQNTHNLTGQPSCHDGRSYEEAGGRDTRVKIREFIESYTRLHDHRPSNAEIGRHLGLSTATISEHMKRLWMFSGPSDYTEISFDQPKAWDPHPTSSQRGSSGQDESLVDTVHYGYSFENELISRIDTYALMRERLEPRERQWMYHFVFEGYEQTQIADRYGYSRSTVRNVIRSAREKLKEVV